MIVLLCSVRVINSIFHRLILFNEERERRKREKEREGRKREMLITRNKGTQNYELQSESLSYNKQCSTVIFSNQMDFVKFCHWIIQDGKSY